MPSPEHLHEIQTSLSVLPDNLRQHVIDHIEQLIQYEPVIGIMGKTGAGKSSLCNALFQGGSVPSQADRHITDKLKDSLSQLDVKVLVHLVVGGAEVVSFAERGWL